MSRLLGSGILCLLGSFLHGQVQTINDFRSTHDQFLWHLDGLGYCTVSASGRTVKYDTKITLWDYDLNVLSEYVIPPETSEGCPVRQCVYDGQDVFLHLCLNGVVVLTSDEPEYKLIGLEQSFDDLCAVNEGCVVIDDILHGTAKYGVDMIKFDKQLEVKWSKKMRPDKGSRMLAIAEPAHGQIALITYRVVGMNASAQLEMVSGENGREYYKIEFEKDGARGGTSILVDKNGSVFISGHAYEKKNSSRPTGFFLLNAGTDGKILLESEFTWDDLRSRWAGKGDALRLDELPVPVLQAVWQTASGEWVVLMETFGQISRRSIKGKRPVTVGDFVILQLTASGELLRVAALHKGDNDYRIETRFVMQDAQEIRREHGFDFITAVESLEGLPAFTYLDKSSASPFIGLASISSDLSVGVIKHRMKGSSSTRVQPNEGNKSLLFSYDEKGELLNMWIASW